MKDIVIERMIVDPGSDCTYSLGVKSEHEFLFEFIARDEIANISVSFHYQHTISIAHPYSASYYEMLGSSVIFESNIYDKFIGALELLKEKKEKEILLYISPESMYPELKLSVLEDVVIIDNHPNRKRKKKELDEGIVKIAFDHIDRLLTMVRKVKDLPYREKIRFTDVNFD